MGQIVKRALLYGGIAVVAAVAVLAYWSRSQQSVHTCDTPPADADIVQQVRVADGALTAQATLDGFVTRLGGSPDDWDETFMPLPSPLPQRRVYEARSSDAVPQVDQIHLVDRDGRWFVLGVCM